MILKAMEELNKTISEGKFDRSETMLTFLLFLAENGTLAQSSIFGLLDDLIAQGVKADAEVQEYFHRLAVIASNFGSETITAHLADKIGTSKSTLNQYKSDDKFLLDREIQDYDIETACIKAAYLVPSAEIAKPTLIEAALTISSSPPSDSKQPGFIKILSDVPLHILKALRRIMFSFQDNQALASQMMANYFSKEGLERALFDTLFNELFALPEPQIKPIFISRLCMTLTKEEHVDFSPVLAEGIN